MKKLRGCISAALVAVFLCLGVVGCTTLETLGDYLNENPVFANIAARQAVGRYIAAADTVEKERQRAADVQRRISKVMVYMDGNPSTDVDGLISIIDKSIDWGELDPPDRLLVMDLVSYIETEIRKHDPPQSSLSEPAIFAIKTLMKTAVSAAEIYLSR